MVLSDDEKTLLARTLVGVVHQNGLAADPPLRVKYTLYKFDIFRPAMLTNFTSLGKVHIWRRVSEILSNSHGIGVGRRVLEREYGHIRDAAKQQYGVAADERAHLRHLAEERAPVAGLANLAIEDEDSGEEAPIDALGAAMARKAARQADEVGARRAAWGAGRPAREAAFSAWIATIPDPAEAARWTATLSSR